MNNTESVVVGFKAMRGKIVAIELENAPQVVYKIFFRGERRRKIKTFFGKILNLLSS